jgi:hypothetical protein
VRADNKCVTEVPFTFKNAPLPLSDGILTVVAAGDIGHTAQERAAAGFAATDFASVFGETEDLISAALYLSTVSNCIRAPGAETNGKNGDVVCGPNFHSVKEDNGTDFFTDALAAGRGDSVTIPKAKLAELAADGTIILTAWPNPGPSGFTGVANIKYKSATLTYDAAVPEPSTWLLFGSGLAGLILWRKRKS